MVLDASIEPHTLECQSSEVICTICATTIPHFAPEYFWGEMINPACIKCRGDDHDEDPFKSFPYGMPSSMVSHWSPPNFPHVQNLGSISSLRSHYIVLHEPGDTFVSGKEFLAELKRQWDEERKAIRNECKQS